MKIRKLTCFLFLTLGIFLSPNVLASEDECATCSEDECVAYSDDECVACSDDDECEETEDLVIKKLKQNLSKELINQLLINGKNFMKLNTDGLMHILSNPDHPFHRRFLMFMQYFDPSSVSLLKEIIYKPFLDHLN